MENPCKTCICCSHWLEWKHEWIAHLQTVKAMSKAAENEMEQKLMEMAAENAQLRDKKLNLEMGKKYCIKYLIG